MMSAESQELCGVDGPALHDLRGPVPDVIFV